MVEIDCNRGPVLLNRDDLTEPMHAAVAQCENRFAVRFAQFLWLPQPVLSTYLGTDYRTVAGRITVVHDTDPSVSHHVQRLTSLANLPDITKRDRETYRDALERLFKLFPLSPDHDSLVVAPRREGAILARRLGWLNSTKHVEPNLKRIPFGGGLLVGCDANLQRRGAANVDVVDGALATGATAMAVLAMSRPSVARVFCAHATAQGLVALLRFAAEIEVDACCIVGDVSGVLNDHFYAVLPDDPALVCVGDLGDTIAPLEDD